jgi:ABC-type transporter Mla MlaB component
MLRVTVKTEDLLEIWELEGKLAGDWVIELERCWKERQVPGTGMRVNLKAISYIDAGGKQLLTDMHEAGVEIKGCGCMTRAVVEDIMRETRTR